MSSRKTTRILIQRPDGKYLIQGCDCADQWTADPHRATPMSLYANESDTNEYRKEGCIVVEFEVVTTLTPTGRTCADLFKDERERRARFRAEIAEEARLAAEAKKAREHEDYLKLAATLGVDPVSEAPNA